MNNTVLVHETVINGEEIAPIVAQIEEAIANAPSRDHVIIALLSMALIVTYPEITPEQLQMSVREVSNYICLILDTPQVEGDKMMLN